MAITSPRIETSAVRMRPATRILSIIFGFVVCGHTSIARSADSDSALQRSVIERNQQNEALSNRVRQGQQLFEAQTRGATPQQLREIEARQLRQRTEQESLNSRQLLEIDRLGAQPRAPATLEAETLRGERERALGRQRAADEALVTTPPSPPPSWTPTLQQRER